MTAKKPQLLFQPEKCSGCTICVIQCAFHHHAAFSLAQSSLEVSRDLPSNTWTIAWHTDQSQTHPACDFCSSDPQGPICVRVCPEKVIKIQEAIP